MGDTSIVRYPIVRLLPPCSPAGHLPTPAIFVLAPIRGISERSCTLFFFVAEADDWNKKIIEEFRANAGVVGGPFQGMPIVLLHHFGARSGTERVNPVAYRRDGDSYVVFASKAGAPTNPDWFHNLQAHPEVDVEVGAETIPVKARVAEGDERDRLWELQKKEYPGFADYEAKTSRQIPVVVLEPR
jgi:deazaflavin-dependent oxidoreductase (nitroreductase family)